ncbi:hypothetical protein [Paraburkholderia phenoliruptrix]|uniref:hypothetical protein n=1 Tax=Paraburkholderia phenoliruptrix TaxID=252970 RepID=UPI001C4F9B5A|nr:hypothetical protein [Paraburkholderia phenoliruptrix]MBW0449035.1 hypothetical protein [Paraburkholderia phenoliruptrix]MBW9097444.1 hypothetical protein [Paraburkholderia phenoliruptrix]
MPKYTTTVRVVLHKDDARTKEHSPDSEEYDTLHAEMHARGFRRYYETVKDQKLKLPPGEYLIYQEGTDVDDARKKVYSKSTAAATIATSAKRFSLFINCEGSLTSSNLEVISKDPDA